MIRPLHSHYLLSHFLCQNIAVPLPSFSFPNTNMQLVPIFKASVFQIFPSVVNFSPRVPQSQCHTHFVWMLHFLGSHAVYMLVAHLPSCNTSKCLQTLEIPPGKELLAFWFFLSVIQHICTEFLLHASHYCRSWGHLHCTSQTECLPSELHLKR